MEASGQALLSQCPNVPDAVARYNTAPGWSYIKVADGLQTPRDLIFDTQGRLLIVEKGVGLSQHIVDAHGCIVNSRQLIANADLNHGIALTADGYTLYASSPSSVFSWKYDPTTGEPYGAGAFRRSRALEDPPTFPMHAPCRQPASRVPRLGLELRFLRHIAQGSWAVQRVKVTFGLTLSGESTLFCARLVSTCKESRFATRTHTGGRLRLSKERGATTIAFRYF